MTQVQLFNKFKEDHHGINMSITTFVQQKPLYVRSNTIHDTCCCHYHVEFQLYKDMFLEFGKILWKNSPPPPTICEFISQTLCERNHDEDLLWKSGFYSTINTLLIMICHFQM